MTATTRLSVLANMNSAGYQKGVGAAVKSNQRLQRSMNRTGRAMKQVSAATTRLVGSLAAFASIASLRGVIETGDELSKLAQRSNLAAESVAALQFAANSLNVDVKKVNKSLNTFAVRVSRLNLDTSSFRTELEALNPQLLKQLESLGSTTEQLDLYIGAIRAAKTENDALSLTQAAFGQGAATGLRQIFRSGDLDELERNLREIAGYVPTLQELINAERNNQAFTNLKAAAEAFGLFVTNAEGYANTINAVAEGFRKATKALMSFTILLDRVDLFFETIPYLIADALLIVADMVFRFGETIVESITGAFDTSVDYSVRRLSDLAEAVVQTKTGIADESLMDFMTKPLGGTEGMTQNSMLGRIFPLMGVKREPIIYDARPTEIESSLYDRIVGKWESFLRDWIAETEKTAAQLRGEYRYPATSGGGVKMSAERFASPMYDIRRDFSYGENEIDPADELGRRVLQYVDMSRSGFLDSYMEMLQGLERFLKQRIDTGEPNEKMRRMEEMHRLHRERVELQEMAERTHHIPDTFQDRIDDMGETLSAAAREMSVIFNSLWQSHSDWATTTANQILSMREPVVRANPMTEERSRRYTASYRDTMASPMYQIPKEMSYGRDGEAIQRAMDRGISYTSFRHNSFLESMIEMVSSFFSGVETAAEVAGNAMKAEAGQEVAESAYSVFRNFLSEGSFSGTERGANYFTRAINNKIAEIERRNARLAEANRTSLLKLLDEDDESAAGVEESRRRSSRGFGTAAVPSGRMIVEFEEGRLQAAFAKALAENRKAQEMIDRRDRVRNDPRQSRAYGREAVGFDHEALAERLKEVDTIFDSIRKKVKDIGDSIQNDMVQALRGAVDVSDLLYNVLDQVLNSLLKQYVATPLFDLILGGITSGFSAGFGGFGGGGATTNQFSNIGSGFGRNLGGRVMAGQPYLVGERRPEIFVPDQTGRIEPNFDRKGIGGGATIINNININGVQDPAVVRNAVRAETPNIVKSTRAALEQDRRRAGR